MTSTEGQPELIERIKIDRLKTEIYVTRKDLGVAAARAMAAKMTELLGQKGKVRIVFASAPSQNEFLAELRTLPNIDWSRVVAFHMDEYVGLGPEAPQAFSKFLVDTLFQYASPGAFYTLNGLAEDPEAECLRYSALLEEEPIDIVCAGIGENGHLAFNDPPVAMFDDPKTVKVVELTHESREQQVHDGCFANLDAVPKLALTLTVPALMSAGHVFTMVPGPTKAQAVKETLLGPVTAACPATALRRHPSAWLYVDTDSAAVYQAARNR